MSKPSAAQIIGNYAENQALAYLQQQGLTLVTRNFRCLRGEIDLIVKDKIELVFVEVRYRRQNKYGGSVETVDASKQKKIIYSAEYYLHKNKLWDHPCRFDVIGLSKDSAKELAIIWEKNAFDRNY